MVDEARPDKIRILFLCTHNACRSQMAEGWAHKLRAEVIEAHSAGIDPGKLDPHVVRVMMEDGCNIHTYKSKPLDSVAELEFDYIITVCDDAREACPAYPETTKLLHVRFDDPAVLAQSARTEKEALAMYRRVRDEIRKFVATLPKSLDRLIERQLAGESIQNDD